MVKNRNWLTLVALIYIQAGNAQITQPYRSNYIKEYMYSCYANQKDNPVNANIEDKLIYQYCKCNAIYTADAITNESLIDITNGNKKLDLSIAKIATKFCSKHYQNYK